MDQLDVFGRQGAMTDVPEAQAGAPDGIGAYARENGGPPVRHMMRPPNEAGDVFGPPLGATLDYLEPDDVSSDAAVRSAGITALLATVAIGTGVAVGGPWGAGAGLLLVGAAANGYRAQKWWSSPEPSEKHEAVVSAVFSAFGIAVGGYMAYKAYEARKGED
jgi:hypothetical protein